MFDVDILFVGFLKTRRVVMTSLTKPEHRDVSRCGWLVVEGCNFATKVSEDRTQVFMLIYLFT